MGLFTGRGKKRIAKGEAVAFAHLDNLGIKHPATMQNVSDSSMRLVTDRIWKPGDRLLLTAPKTSRRIQARVTYCERLKDERFAVGLQLAGSIDDERRPL